MKRITIYDVAKEADVSLATVSRDFLQCENIKWIDEYRKYISL